MVKFQIFFKGLSWEIKFTSFHWFTYSVTNFIEMKKFDWFTSCLNGNLFPSTRLLTCFRSIASYKKMHPNLIFKKITAKDIIFWYQEFLLRLSKCSEFRLKHNRMNFHIFQNLCSHGECWITCIWKMLGKENFSLKWCRQ